MITPYTISVAALTISLVSLLFQQIRWRESNRPIVSAYICDARKERDVNKWCSFNLVLVNSGAVPASNIRLHAKQSDINKIFSEEIKEVYKEVVINCFDKKRIIPLLLNGEKIETFFGNAERIGHGKWIGLEYDSFLPIKITYCDLNRKRYQTKLKLKVRDSYGFGGAVLKITKQPS